MAVFKKLVFILVLCAGFSQAIAVRYPYISLPEDECPRDTVRVGYVAVSDLTVPSDHPHMPGTHFVELTTEPVYRIVDVIFRPGQFLPTVIIPADFPLDMNNLVHPFLTHILAGRSADEFPQTVRGFSRVTGQLVCDITLAEREVIGRRTLSLIQTPLDFFRELERTIKRIQQEGFLALCRHNPGLMSVMDRILKGGNLRDVEYDNLLDLGRIFHNAGMGLLKENGEEGFSLKIGRLRFSTAPSHNPRDMQLSMADFLRRAISPQVLQVIEALFPEAGIENIPLAAAAHASSELDETRVISDSAEGEGAASAPAQGRGMYQGGEGNDLDGEGAQHAFVSGEGGSLAETVQQDVGQAAAELLSRKTAAVTEIQRTFRGHVARTQFLKTKDAAITLQQAFRARVAGKAARAAYMNTRKAAVDIQRVFRGFKARRDFQSVRNATVVLQRAVREYMQRERAPALSASTGVDASLVDHLAHEVSTVAAAMHLGERDEQPSVAERRAVGYPLDGSADEERRVLDVPLEVADVFEDAQRDAPALALLGGEQSQQQDRREITVLLGGQPIGAAAPTLGQQSLDAVSTLVAGGASGASGVLSADQGHRRREVQPKKKGGCALL